MPSAPAVQYDAEVPNIVAQYTVKIGPPKPFTSKTDDNIDRCLYAIGL